VNNLIQPRRLRRHGRGVAPDTDRADSGLRTRTVPPSARRSRGSLRRSPRRRRQATPLHRRVIDWPL